MIAAANASPAPTVLRTSAEGSEARGNLLTTFDQHGPTGAESDRGERRVREFRHLLVLDLVDDVEMFSARTFRDRRVTE